MDLIQEEQYFLFGLSRINILLGKNGCGKSSLLKKVEQDLTAQDLGEISYVTPERGGFFADVGVPANIKRQRLMPSQDKCIT